MLFTVYPDILTHLALRLMAGLPPHVYQPLQSPTSIRLLQLHSVRGESEEKANSSCFWTLVHANLDRDTPSYTCISYTWGDGHFSVPILLADGTAIMTSPNARDAIMGYDIGAYIWIDQVCINQKDIVERGSQVQLMTRIYSQCVRCDVWLGEANQDTHEAFSIIRDISSCLEGRFDLDEWPWLFVQSHSRIVEFLREKTPPIEIPAGDDDRWLPLIRFLKHSWFSRVWTFQEAVVAKEVFFKSGDQRTSFETVVSAALLLGYEYPWELRPPWARYNTLLVRASRLKFHSHIKESLLDLLSNFRLDSTSNTGFFCSDAHDVVYAVIGLLQDSAKSAIQIDYRTPLALLFTQVARAIIVETQNLCILCHTSNQGNREVGNLPSWVLDWNSSIPNDAIEYLDPEEPFFRASRGLTYRTPPPHPSNTVEELIVKGRICDTVTKVVYMDLSHSNSRDGRLNWAFREALPRLGRILDMKGVKSPHEAQAKIFNTLTVSGLMSGISGSSKAEWTSVKINERLDELFGVADYDLQLPNLEDEQLLETFPSDLQRWIRSLRIQLDVCVGRRFAVVERHCLALGPLTMTQGDIVAILHGMSVPAVLRRVDDKFLFIGPCFVDGMMFGEACDWEVHEADSFVLV